MHCLLIKMTTPICFLILITNNMMTINIDYCTFPINRSLLYIMCSIISIIGDTFTNRNIVHRWCKTKLALHK